MNWSDYLTVDPAKCEPNARLEFKNLNSFRRLEQAVAAGEAWLRMCGDHGLYLQRSVTLRPEHLPTWNEGT